jgi:CelD/BcsL family acetyltransferase involved in cellulose biosynthesis
MGLPVAARVSAVHGVVARADLHWDPLQLLREAGLSGLRYDCAIADQVGLRPYHLCEHRFPYVAIDAGYDALRQQHLSSGSSLFRQIDRKARKMEREVGPLGFDLHVPDDEAFAALLRWKSAQYRRTGTLDVLAIGWVAELLGRIRELQLESFGGVLSVLRSGGRIAAVHLGMRSRDVLAWWFPAYSLDLAIYSPGLVLIDRVLRASAEAGIKRLDLGQGGERYKARLRSGAFDVAEGVAERRRGRRWLRRTWVLARDWAGRTPSAAKSLRAFRAIRNRMILDR